MFLRRIQYEAQAQQFERVGRELSQSPVSRVKLDPKPAMKFQLPESRPNPIPSQPKPILKAKFVIIIQSFFSMSTRLEPENSIKDYPKPDPKRKKINQYVNTIIEKQPTVIYLISIFPFLYKIEHIYAHLYSNIIIFFNLKSFRNFFGKIGSTRSRIERKLQCQPGPVRAESRIGCR